MKKAEGKTSKTKNAKVKFNTQKGKEFHIFRGKSTTEIGLKGPVSKVEQYTCKAIFKSGYIVKGDLVIDTHLDETIIAWFNEKGQKIKHEMFWYGVESAVDYFNEAGAETEFQLFTDGVLKSSGTRKYNEAGKRLEMATFDEKNVYKSGIKWKYDDRGNNTIIENYGPEKNLTDTMTMVYNENNQKIEDKRMDVTGKITYWSMIGYDSHGRECERIMLNADGSENSRTLHRNIYNSEGEIIGQDDRLYSKHVPLDDAEAEHDEHGNWVTKIKFHNNVPACIVFRDISYFGEAEKPSGKKDVEEHTLKFSYSNDNMDKWERDMAERKVEQLFQTPPKLLHNYEPEVVRWLAENAALENFPAMKYYAMANNDIPTVVYFAEDDYEVLALFFMLREEMNAKLIHSYQSRNGYDEFSSMNNYTLSFPNNGYVLQAPQISCVNDNEYKVPDFIRSTVRSYDGWVRISPLRLLRPSEASGKRDEDFESELEAFLDLCIIESLPDKPEISMVEVGDNGYFKLKTYPVYDNFLIKNLDMHYGYGFEKFHNDLMHRFESQSSGLVLFHGLPGTGKTYYIRHLLRKMTSSKKVVIYMPPNMVDRLIDPYFMTFLSKEIARFSKDGFFCVLLIEDAEPLLASRQGEGRVMGISNLLNMTDGILNDMLKLQIICTFNVKVKELDKALLRPGRLIARKEFKAMTTLDANRLAQQLGVKHHFDKPVTLAEVYALVKNKNTLMHGDGEIEADFD